MMPPSLSWPACSVQEEAEEGAFGDAEEDPDVCTSVSARSRGMWYAGAFQFSASPRFDKNVKPEDLEKEIWAEIEKIQKEGVTPEEIQQVKNRSRAMFVRSLSSSMGLARSLGRAELNRGWRSIMTDFDDLKNVTNDDIKRVAAKYFVKDNSLTAIYTRTMGQRQRRR